MRWAAACMVLLAGCPPTLSRPGSPAFETRLAYGEREMRHGRFAAAEVAFAEAAAVARRRVDRDEALYRRSRALRRSRRFAEAVEVLEKIAARRPPSRRTARALFDAARLRDEHLGETELAVAGYARVVREHSNEGPASRALALWLAHARGRSPTQALSLVTSLEAELAGTDLGDDLLMAEHGLRLEVGDRAGARDALERIVRAYPYPQGHRWDEALLRLADMELEDSRPLRAIGWLEELLQRAETTTLVGSYTLPAFPLAQLRIARIHRDFTGDTEAARRAFRDVARNFPDSRLRDDATVELGELLLDHGDTVGGCQLLRAALREFEVGSARRRALRRVTSDCTPAPQ